MLISLCCVMEFRSLSSSSLPPLPPPIPIPFLVSFYPLWLYSHLLPGDAELQQSCSLCSTFQEHLPAAGLKGEEQQQQSLDDLYNNYVASRTQSNWKFWVFSFLTRPFYDSYKASVSTANCKDFLASLGQWLIHGVSLANIRRMMLQSVLRFSKETRIMTDPDSLREEALASVSGPGATSTHPSPSSSTS